MNMKIAVVGATGMVGNVMLQLLAERDFPVSELIPVASEKSVGKSIEFKGKQVLIRSMHAAIDLRPDIAIFSAGGGTALEFAPRFAGVGTVVIDNSSAFRMDKDKPLIVPEVNIDALHKGDMIIANPNCSTIQMVVALNPLHKAYGIDRLVISTYQSMTGTGVKAVKQYDMENEGRTADDPAYPHPIYKNCIPHCDIFYDNGYTKEELKLVNETQKIFNDSTLRITATAVRVPVLGGHSECINIRFKNDFDLSEVRSLLENSPGIVVMDDIQNNVYPTPLFSHQKDEVFVGRIRRDESQSNSLNLWVVADNLRKGAATNAIQIAEYIVQKGWTNS